MIHGWYRSQRTKQTSLNILLPLLKKKQKNLALWTILKTTVLSKNNNNLRLHIVCWSVLILKFYLMSTLSHQQRRTQGACIHEVARVLIMSRHQMRFKFISHQNNSACHSHIHEETGVNRSSTVTIREEHMWPYVDTRSSLTCLQFLQTSSRET